MIFPWGQTRTRINRRPYRARPAIVPLEERCLLSGLWTEFPLTNHDAGVSAIATGPDGNLWFTETGVHKIGRLSTAGDLTEFDLGPASRPGAIVLGSDDSYWFTDAGTDAIGRITVNGIVQEYSLPAFELAAPALLARGSDGKIWFTEQGASRLGRLSLDGTFTFFNLGNFTPSSLTTGPDSEIWFSDSSRIGRWNADGSTTVFTVPNSFGAIGPLSVLPLGTIGAFWFSEVSGSHQVGIMTTSGSFGQISLGPGRDAVGGMSPGPDGMFWLIETSGVARFDPASGALTEFPLTQPLPAVFTFGADGNLWFAAGDRVAKLERNLLPPVTLSASSATAFLTFAAVYGSILPVASAPIQLTVDWGDGQVSSREFNVADTSSIQFLASHTYLDVGPHRISFALVQSDGVTVRSTFFTVTPTSGGFGGVPGSTTGFSGGAGGGVTVPPTVLDYEGMPWRSLADHSAGGGDQAWGAPAWYASRPAESFSSISASRTVSPQAALSTGSSISVLTVYLTSGSAAKPANAPRLEQSSDTQKDNARPTSVASSPGGTSPNRSTSRALATSTDNGASAIANASSHSHSRANYEIAREAEMDSTALTDDVVLGEVDLLVDSAPQIVMDPAPDRQAMLQVAEQILAAETHGKAKRVASYATLDPVLTGVAVALVLAQSARWHPEGFNESGPRQDDESRHQREATRRR